jgi:hypothetical protein
MRLAWRRIRRTVAGVFDYLDDKWRLMLPDPPPPADPPGTEPPIRMDPDSATLESGEYPSAIGSPPVVSFRGIVKQSLTKKSRMDLGQAMISMCTLSGWQSTVLNPDMGDVEKLAIVTARFGKLAAQDHPADLYSELMAVSAATTGWAQGIARREARERKRRSREQKRIRREERKRAKRKAAEDDG